MNIVPVEFGDLDRATWIPVKAVYSLPVLISMFRTSSIRLTRTN